VNKKGENEDFCIPKYMASIAKTRKALSGYAYTLPLWSSNEEMIQVKPDSALNFPITLYLYIAVLPKALPSPAMLPKKLEIAPP
jgi:hypothetical protein